MKSKKIFTLSCDVLLNILPIIINTDPKSHFCQNKFFYWQKSLMFKTSFIQSKNQSTVLFWSMSEPFCFIILRKTIFDGQKSSSCPQCVLYWNTRKMFNKYTVLSLFYWKSKCQTIRLFSFAFCSTNKNKRFFDKKNNTKILVETKLINRRQNVGGVDFKFQCHLLKN